MLDKVKRNQMLITILGVIILTVLVIGITYAGFSQTTSGGNNSISSGTITMSFQEPSNNVVITNAMPISGTNYTSTTHFDFSVSGTAKVAIPIAYEISITEKSGNTIDSQYVMIGLKKNGTIVYPYGIRVGNLRSSSIRNGSKILIKDQFTLAQSGSNYTATDNYQLFLWLSEDYEMPSDGSTESYSISVNVNSNVGAVGVTNVKYVVSDTDMNIGNPLPSGVNGRSTPELAMADWASIIGTPGETRPFYLRHVLNSNDEIEDSYVEFVVTEDMTNANSGMVAGTYSLKGEDSGASYTTNVDTIKAAFGYSTNPSRCTDYGTYFRCSVSGLRASAFSDGTVSASGADGYNCYMNPDGSSSCGIR